MAGARLSGSSTTSHSATAVAAHEPNVTLRLITASTTNSRNQGRRSFNTETRRFGVQALACPDSLQPEA